MNKLQKKLIDFLTSVSIELKILGMVVIVIVLVTVIGLMVVRVSVSNTLTLQIEDRAKSISSDLAARSVDPLLTHNIFALQSLITDTLTSYQDIEYIFIISKEGEVLVHSNEQGFISRDLVQANDVRPESDMLITNGKKLTTNYGPIFDSASPILQDLGSTVRIGLTYQSLEDALLKVTSQMLFTMLGVIILAGVIVFSLTKIITLPISKLVKLTNKVSIGYFSDRISNYPHDEIGKLTSSFNKMLDALQKSEKDKMKYIDKIHNRNKELTLLNSLAQNFKNNNQLKQMLQFFIKQLVKDFHFKSVTIELELAGTKEKFSDHSCANALTCAQLDNQVDRCTFQDKEFYHFSLKKNGGTVIGKITICSSAKLDDNFIQILTSFANQLSISVENLELWKEVKKKEGIRLMLLEKLITAQEEERKRIARELHDETSHTLSSMLVELKLLEEGDIHTQEKSINHLRNLVRTTMEEVHQLAWQLRPTILDKFGLQVAIERYVEEFERSSGIEVDLFVKGIEKNFTPEQDTTIFRLIQESLTNITKYAKAKDVSIIMMTTGKHLSVIVEDDGVGFDTERVLGKDPSKNHLGLLGMQERVALLNGTLEIESEIGKGTTVIAKIPLFQDRGESIVC